MRVEKHRDVFLRKPNDQSNCKWIPAFAGMTGEELDPGLRQNDS